MEIMEEYGEKLKEKRKSKTPRYSLRNRATGEILQTFSSKLEAYRYHETQELRCRGNGWMMGFVFKPEGKGQATMEIVDSKTGNRLSYNKTEFDRLERKDAQ